MKEIISASLSIAFSLLGLNINHQELQDLTTLTEAGLQHIQEQRNTTSLGTGSGQIIPASWEQAQVAKVIDGDTIQLTDGRKVRYIGVNTPETKHPTRGVECFGQAASEKNTALVLNQTVYLEKDISETDRYGRLLRYVWLNGELINLKLAAEGYAQVATYPPDIKYQALFTAAAQEARQNNLGLWDKQNCP